MQEAKNGGLFWVAALCWLTFAAIVGSCVAICLFCSATTGMVAVYLGALFIAAMIGGIVEKSGGWRAQCLT